MTKKDWHNPHSIRFSRQQIKWLISILSILRDGEYPPNPKESGYTDQGIQSRQFRPGAKFETPAGIAAELDYRIQRAGLDGLLLELLYTNEPDDELFVIQHIAYALNEEVIDIEQRIKNALTYISGDGRKVPSYYKFLRHEKADGDREGSGVATKVVNHSPDP